MQVPTRRIKNVDGGFKQDGSVTESLKPDSFQEWMIAPFHKADGPNAWHTIVVVILVFTGVIANSWIFHAVLDGLLKSTLVPGAGDFMIRALLMGMTTATLFMVISGWWSFDDQLPTLIYPELALAKVASQKNRLGLVVALVYCGIIFGAAAAAGGILRVLDSAPVNAGIINAATNADGRWLYWFGTSLFVFAFLFCSNMLQDGESDMKAYYRSIKAGAGMLFVLTVGFASHGLRSFSSSHYVTASIATGISLDWPIYVFVALLAAPATAIVLYGLISFLVSRQGGRYTDLMKKTDGAQAEIPMNASSRVRGKIQVQY
jgi:hypothetical protein